VSGMDAIEAETDVIILDGSFDLHSGGGSGARVSEDISSKGIKAARNLAISGGSYIINTADDGLHSINSMDIQMGRFSISSGDDGFHADETLTVDGGLIEILESYEGLESAIMTINVGEIRVNSSDDGVNLAGGADGSGMPDGTQGGQEHGRRHGPGGDSFAEMSNYCLYINGVTTVINANGDGIDSNGSIEMTGGIVTINGPTESMNGAIDYLGTFNISGGVIVAVGSEGMAMAPSDNSSQPFMVGGEVAGSNNNDLLPEGSYSGGNEVTNFTITDIVTYIGRSGRNGGW